MNNNTANMAIANYFQPFLRYSAICIMREFGNEVGALA